MLFQLLKCETKLFLRNFINAFFCILFPPVMILLFGSIYGNTPSSEFMGRGMVDVSVPAYFALIISVTAFMSIPMTLSEYREKKILKKYMTTPLRKTDILIALLIINLITTLLGIVLLYITAKIQYSIKFEGNFIIFALCLLLSICSMYSFGLLLSNLGKTIKTTNTICYCMFFPMLFLSGATIPKEIFPVSVLNVSKVLPLSYVVDVLKNTWIGDDFKDLWFGILFLSVTLVVCTVLNQRLFKWE